MRLWTLSALALLLYVRGCTGVFSRNLAKTRPRAVTVDVNNAKGVLVKWLMPDEEWLRSCRIRHFVLRLKTAEEDKSRKYRIDARKRSFTIPKLKHNSSYYIRLLAFTCVGKGRPTRWIKVMTGPVADHFMDDQPTGDEPEDLRTPGKPLYLRTRTYSNSIILSWRPPSGSALVRGYMIGYGERVPDVKWQYIEGYRRNFTIRNLKPSTQYVLSLRAFNNNGRGPVVYDLVYTREGLGPTMEPFTAPVNVEARVLSPTTVWIQWTDPSLGRAQQVTDDRFYVVSYYTKSGRRDYKQHTKEARSLHAVIDELIPDTLYAFKVRVVRATHLSVYSQAVSAKTYESGLSVKPSSPPRHVKLTVTDEDSTSCIVAWQPPRRPNGKIVSYLVMHSTNPNLPEEEWNAKAVLGNVTEVTIKGLDPNVTNYVRLQATNAKGSSPMSRIQKLESLQEGPQKLLSNKLVNSVKERPMKQPTASALKALDETVSLLKNESLSSAGSQHRQNAIQRDATGKVAPPVTFTSQVTTLVSAALCWTAVDGAAQYRLRYSALNRDDELEIVTSQPLVLLQGLEQNTEYHYRLRVEYEGVDKLSDWTPKVLRNFCLQDSNSREINAFPQVLYCKLNSITKCCRKWTC